MVRYRKWAELLRTDRGGARLAALAVEMEEAGQRLRELATAAEQKRRYRDALRREILDLIARAHSELAYARHLSRDHSYSAEDLREESRLCREEARSAEDGAVRRDFAGKAFELAMIGEAVERSKEADQG